MIPTFVHDQLNNNALSATGQECGSITVRKHAPLYEIHLNSSVAPEAVQASSSTLEPVPCPRVRVRIFCLHGPLSDPFGVGLGCRRHLGPCCTNCSLRIVQTAAKSVSTPWDPKLLVIAELRFLVATAEGLVAAPLSPTRTINSLRSLRCITSSMLCRSLSLCMHVVRVCDGPS